MAVSGPRRCWRAGLAGLLALLAGCTPAGPHAFLEGRRLMNRGEYQQAIEKLRAATVLLGGTNALAWNDLGLACHHAGGAVEAEHAYRRALTLNQDLSEARYNLGCLWLSQNRLEAAKAEFAAYTLRRPTEAPGFLKLGTAQLRTRELNAAEKSFREALRLQRQNPEALNGLGLVLLGRGQATAAARCFEAALEQQADYGPALLNLAIVSHQHLRNRQAALEKYRAYAALKPAPANAQAVQATIRQLEMELAPPARPATTSPTVPAIQVTPPPQPAAPPATGAVATHKPEPTLETPKTTTASAPKASPTSAPSPAPIISPPPPATTGIVRPSVESAFQHSPPVVARPIPAQGSPAEPLIITSSVPARVAASQTDKRGFFQRINPLNLVRSKEKTPPQPTPLRPTPGAELPESVRTDTTGTTPTPGVFAAPELGGQLNRYAYHSPATPSRGNRLEVEAAFTRGVRAQQTRRWAEAKQAYQQAVQLDPSLFEAHYNLGLVAAETGNLPLALRAYETALALEPSSNDARYNFALVLKRANCPRDAVNELEKIVAHSPNETRAHLALGNLYAQQLKQPTRARQHYLKVLELEPQHPQASAINFWLASPQP